jgi:hypothetical protein
LDGEDIKFLMDLHPIQKQNIRTTQLRITIKPTRYLMVGDERQIGVLRCKQSMLGFQMSARGKPVKLASQHGPKEK